MLSVVGELLLEGLGENANSLLAWELAEPELLRRLAARVDSLSWIEDDLTRLQAGEGLSGEQRAFPTEREWELVLLRLSKDRERGRRMLAWAAAHLSGDGELLFAGENQRGIKGFGKALRALFGEVENVSRGHCRLWRCRRPLAVSTPLAEPEAAYEVEGIGTIYTQPGVFSWKRLDRGTEALLHWLPNDYTDLRVLDLGCGAGVLALTMAKHGAAEVVAVDSSALAVESARRTLTDYPNATVLASDVGDDLADSFDIVISNLPVHEGAQPSHRLGERFIEASHRLLSDDGELWVVYQERLPFEETLQRYFGEIDWLDAPRGYTVARAVKG
jgi:16S rRNA (guanine1207-N2)-methyltransferase